MRSSSISVDALVRRHAHGPMAPNVYLISHTHTRTHAMCAMFACGAKPVALLAVCVSRTDRPTDRPTCTRIHVLYAKLCATMAMADCGPPQRQQQQHKQQPEKSDARVKQHHHVMYTFAALITRCARRRRRRRRWVCARFFLYYYFNSIVIIRAWNTLRSGWLAIMRSGGE